MKRNRVVVCVLAGLCVAIFIAMTVSGFVFDVLPAGVVGAVMTAVSLWGLAGSIFCERVYDTATARYRVGDYAAARAVLDKAERNHLFYPIARITLLQLYVVVALTQDDTATAERYVSRLRHNGGDGWRYRTAYFIVLLNLDWGDLPAATAEYEAFRSACSASEIYKSRIEVLDAIFANIHGEPRPMPDAAKQSKYPILHRVVQKYC